MKELIKFELYKMITQKKIYITAILLLIISVFFLLQMRETSTYNLYDKWEGPVTAQDIEKAHQKDVEISKKQDQGISISDEKIKKQYLYDDLLEIDMYNRTQENKIQQLSEEISGFNNKTEYTYRKLQLEKKMIEDISYKTLYYQKSAEHIQNFLNTYGFVFLSSLILLGISPLFTEEYTTGVNQYILSSKLGRKSIVHAKVITSIIFVFLVMIISIGFSFLFWNIFSGNYGWKAAIQSITYFWDSPYSFNIFSYFLIKAGFQFFMACSFALFVALVSALNKSTIISFVVSGFILCFPIAIETFLTNGLPSCLHQAFKFTYSHGMIVDILFKEFETINLFGIPILLPVFVIFLYTLISLIVLLFLYRVISNKQLY